jgi:RNA polymerase sigma-70 factor (ECF subfamily)
MSAPSPISPGFKGEASLATWLARIVLSQAKARLRHRRSTVDIGRPARRGRKSRLRPMSRGASQARNRRWRAQEIGHAIEQAVDALPAAFRSVFILRAHEWP